MHQLTGTHALLTRDFKQSEIALKYYTRSGQKDVICCCTRYRIQNTITLKVPTFHKIPSHVFYR